jgi:hypothetical protein
MVEDVGTTCVQTSGCPVMGGPTVPVARTWVPESLPLFAPVLGIVTIAKAEQLTGMSLPRKKMTGWAGSELHWTIDASAPGEKPVPATLTVSPDARPLHTGAAGLALLHVAPAPEVLKLRVVVAAADIDAMLNATRLPPLPKKITPVATRAEIVPERLVSEKPFAFTGGLFRSSLFVLWRPSAARMETRGSQCLSTPGARLNHHHN